MDGNQRVWAPHPVEGYQMGIIVDVGADTLSVESLETPGQVSTTALVYTHTLGSTCTTPRALPVSFVQQRIFEPRS